MSTPASLPEPQIVAVDSEGCLLLKTGSRTGRVYDPATEHASDEQQLTVLVRSNVWRTPTRRYDVASIRRLLASDA